MQWEAPQENRLDVGDGSHMQGMGASLAWDCSTAPCPVPRINKCIISYRLASRRRWEIHLNQISSILVTSGRLWGTHSSPFWLNVCFNLAWRRLNCLHVLPEPHRVGWGVLRGWDMPSYSRKHQGYFKAQNLLEIFLKADLSYSEWWAWTDIANAMSHWSIVGRYILLSHLQAHGEPICNVVLHGHLMCCGFGSVPLLLRVCFSSLFFSVRQAADYK